MFEGEGGCKKSEGQNDNKPRSKQTISGDHHGVYSALQGNKQNKENAAICRARLHSNDVGAKSMDKRTRGQWDKEKGKHCTRCTGLFIRNKHRVDINGQERGGWIEAQGFYV